MRHMEENDWAKKHRALHNALTNADVGPSPNEALHDVFRNHIEVLTGWHIRILGFLAGPEKYAAEVGLKVPTSEGSLGGAPQDALETVFPELREHRDMQRIMVLDLHRRGLITTDQLDHPVSSSAVLVKRTTEMGDRFLNLVREG